MDKGIELRWLQKGTSKILQYRTVVPRTNYSFAEPYSPYVTEYVWTEWMDVPTVEGDRV